MIYERLEDASLVYRPRDPRPDVEGGELGELIGFLAGLPKEWQVHIRIAQRGRGAMTVGQLVGSMRAGSRLAEPTEAIAAHEPS